MSTLPMSLHSILLLTFVVYCLSAPIKVFSDRTEWQNNVGSWKYVIESWPSNGDPITSPIVLPSGSSFNLVPSTVTKVGVGKSARNYLNLILMYGDNPTTPNVIVYDTQPINGSPVKLVFASPIISFGMDMEPTSFGNFEMSIIVNEGTISSTILTQTVSSSEELASPTFFGFSGYENHTISSITLISYDSNSFVICKMVESQITSPTVSPVLSPVAATADTSLYTDLGCYADGNPRAMKQLKELGIYNTIDTCYAAAMNKGYSLFALQWGGECWVSNSLIESKKYLSSNNCNMPCRSNTKQQCGGSLANNLFSLNILISSVTNPTISPILKPTPSPVAIATDTPVTSLYTNLGCYADGNPRAMKQLKELGIYNTIDTCYAAAMNKGYSLFALQWGGECWVSNSLIESQKYQLLETQIIGDKKGCFMPCRSDNTKFCGGPLANNLFSIGPK